ncbi:ImmA/IrrE family metallo-endopeptidase [Bifidobacterium dentium]|nr:ImmA/IrrE family metallo-endopeptidase [Bifidobacterium dentium]NEG52949.1 ImmA/IrrE family metallo-endopeptidase [Bifidobacterium dentium]
MMGLVFYLIPLVFVAYAKQQVWFRSLRKSTARQRKSAIGHGRSALLLFHWIESHFRLPNCDLPMEQMAQMPPEASALALRGDWSYGENPLPNMVSLAESHGIRVFCLPSVGKEVDAFSFVFDGQPYIAVDAHKTPECVRFDIFIRQLYDGRFRRTGDG